MFTISEFRHRTATAAKDAVKLYFEPLVTLASILFPSKNKKSKISFTEAADNTKNSQR